MTSVQFRLQFHLSPHLDDQPWSGFATYSLKDPFAVELWFPGQPTWSFAWELLDRRRAPHPVPGQDVVTAWLDNGVLRLRLIGTHVLDLHIADDDPELLTLVAVMNALQTQADQHQIDSELDAELALILGAAGIDTE